MSDAHTKILNALERGCAEADFASMCCPVCEGRLVLRVHPSKSVFAIRCEHDTTHLMMHGEPVNAPDWFAKYVGGGWY